MTEAWKRRKLQKAKRKQNWYYSCAAIQWWGDDVEHATFPYKDRDKKDAWEEYYLEKDWRVSIKLVRVS